MRKCGRINLMPSRISGLCPCLRPGQETNRRGRRLLSLYPRIYTPQEAANVELLVLVNFRRAARGLSFAGSAPYRKVGWEAVSAVLRSGGGVAVTFSTREPNFDQRQDAIYKALAVLEDIGNDYRHIFCSRLLCNFLVVLALRRSSPLFHSPSWRLEWVSGKQAAYTERQGHGRNCESSPLLSE